MPQLLRPSAYPTLTSGTGADCQGVRLDFGGEVAALTDHVAIKLVDVLAADLHFDDLSLVLVDLVVLLRWTE